MEEDSQSWQDRCDRYFTSISESGNSTGHSGSGKQNGHIKNKQKLKSSDGNIYGVYLSENDKTAWKDLCAVRKHKKGHPLFRYIRSAVFKLDFHGSKFAGQTDNVIGLIIWGMIILALISFTLFLIVLQYKDYQKNNTYFKMRTSTNDIKLTSFPVVSICNMNVLKNQSLRGSRFEYLINNSISHDLSLNQTKISKSSIQTVLESNTKLSKLINSVNDQVAENMTSLLQHDIVIREILRESNESLISRLRKTGAPSWFHDIVSLNQSDVTEYGHSLRDTLVSCFIDSRECTERSFHVNQDEHLGNCFSFSPDDNSKTAHLILNAEAHEYIAGTSDAVGFKMILHQNGSDVVDGKIIHVAVNSFTSIKLDQMRVVARKEEDCSRRPATKKQCLRNCYATRIRDYCNCDEDTNTALPICGLDRVDDLTCRKVVKILFDKNLLGCNCKENCRETMYETYHSTMTWPSAEEIPTITSMLQEKRNVSFTEYQIRSNLAKVEISLKPESFIYVEETDEFGILDIMARVGGLFAFVAGMSVLTLLELVWTFVKSVFDTIVHIKTRSNRLDEKERLSDSEITSVTWAMYKQKRRQEELAKEQPTNNERSDKMRHLGNGLGGNVNSRLHRRNSNLAPISEDGHISKAEELTPYKVQHRAKSDRNSFELNNDYHQLYELKSNKYRVMNPNNIKRHVDYNGHSQQNYSDRYSDPHHDGVTVISPSYSSSVSYNENRNSPSIQNPDRWHYDKGGDRLQYGYTSAYFHTRISEPTFL